MRPVSEEAQFHGERRIMNVFSYPVTMGRVVFLVHDALYLVLSLQSPSVRVYISLGVRESCARQTEIHRYMDSLTRAFLFLFSGMRG